MTKYAEGTTVPVGRTRDEIERTLARFGASEFGYMTNAAGDVGIAFSVHGRRVLMQMKTPPRADYAVDARGRRRADTAIDRDHDAATRRLWRSLANGIKAKLAMVEDGISSVEREFMADTMLPDGSRVADHVEPFVATAYATGAVRPLLGGTDAAIALPERTTETR